MTTVQASVHKIRALCDLAISKLTEKAEKAEEKIPAPARLSRFLEGIVPFGDLITENGKERLAALYEVAHLLDRLERVEVIREMCDMVGDQHFGTVTLSDSDYLLLRPFACTGGDEGVDS